MGDHSESGDNPSDSRDNVAEPTPGETFLKSKNGVCNNTKTGFCFLLVGLALITLCVCQFTHGNAYINQGGVIAIFMINAFGLFCYFGWLTIVAVGACGDSHFSY